MELGPRDGEEGGERSPESAAVNKGLDFGASFLVTVITDSNSGRGSCLFGPRKWIELMLR